MLAAMPLLPARGMLHAVETQRAPPRAELKEKTESLPVLGKPLAAHACSPVFPIWVCVIVFTVTVWRRHVIRLLNAHSRLSIVLDENLLDGGFRGWGVGVTPALGLSGPRRLRRPGRR